MDAQSTEQKTPTARRATRAQALLKIMAWGEPGAGKTRFALSFPAPLVIDLERGSEWYAGEFDFYVATPTVDLKAGMLVKQVLDEVQAGLYPDRKTLVIDPITDYLDALETALIEEQRRKGVDLDTLKGPKRAQVYAVIRDAIRARLDKLIQLPLNVVLVARAKNVWSVEGGQMQPTGRTYDAKDIVEYLCDVVLHMDRGGAAVKKSRIAALPERLDHPSYQVIAGSLYRDGVRDQPARQEQSAQPAARGRLPAVVTAAYKAIDAAKTEAEISTLNTDFVKSDNPAIKQHLMDLAQRCAARACDLRAADGPDQRPRCDECGGPTDEPPRHGCQGPMNHNPRG